MTVTMLQSEVGFWTEEQTALREAAIEFARGSLKDDMIARDESSTFSREMWSRCAEFGIQGMPFPVEYGGGDQDILTTIHVLEGLGYACNDGGLLFALNAQMWSVQMPIWRYGTDAQKAEFLTKLCTGEWIGAHAMSEPDSGSDAFSMRTTARRDGDYYVLNGRKTFVSDAPVADMFIVFATIDPSLGVHGVTGFMIPRDTPGLEVSAPIHKMGLRTSPMADVILESVRVPVANRLGREGRGAGIFNDSMEWERSFILTHCVGAMQRQLETCVKHARERHQFGHPIGDFQSVSNRLVAMRVRLEAAQLMLYRVGWLRQQGADTSAHAAMTKLFISEAWIQSCMDAVQVHGGYGYMVEYEIERDLRDSIGSTLYSGTSEIQKAIIARSLGL